MVSGIKSTMFGPGGRRRRGQREGSNGPHPKELSSRLVHLPDWLPPDSILELKLQPSVLHTVRCFHPRAGKCATIQTAPLVLSTEVDIPPE